MINSRSLDDLLPAVKERVERFIASAKTEGIDLLVTSTYRDNESQNALYEQGRTASGKVVTNAKEKASTRMVDKILTEIQNVGETRSELWIYERIFDGVSNGEWYNPAFNLRKYVEEILLKQGTKEHQRETAKSMARMYFEFHNKKF